jgi:hypothetical protein
VDPFFAGGAARPADQGPGRAVRAQLPGEGLEGRDRGRLQTRRCGEEAPERVVANGGDALDQAGRPAASRRFARIANADDAGVETAIRAPIEPRVQRRAGVHRFVHRIGPRVGRLDDHQGGVG